MLGGRTAGSTHALWRKLKGQLGQLTRISDRNPWQKLSPDDWVNILTASAVFDLGTTQTPKISPMGQTG